MKHQAYEHFSGCSKSLCRVSILFSLNRFYVLRYKELENANKPSKIETERSPFIKSHENVVYVHSGNMAMVWRWQAMVSSDDNMTCSIRKQLNAFTEKRKVDDERMKKYNEDSVNFVKLGNYVITLTDVCSTEGKQMVMCKGNIIFCHVDCFCLQEERR